METHFHASRFLAEIPAHLMDAVTETMQPERIVMWIQHGQKPARRVK
ncbi:MAG: hypothetical protein ABIQ99_14235 [Thermoflexales bacterium]